MKKDLLTAIVIAVVASATFVGVTAMQSTYNTTNDGSNVIKLKGHVSMVLKDEFGKIKDYREFDNVVVKNGQDLVGLRVFGSNSTMSAATANFIAIGNNTAALTQGITNTALGTECTGGGSYARQNPTTTPNLQTNVQGTSTSTKITIAGTFGAGNCSNANGSNQSITEAGLFNALTGGNLFARQTFAAINKGPSDSLTVTWTVTLS